MKIHFLALFLLTSSAFGQTIKSYSGPVDGGTVSYQYYEDDDLERIYNGSYSFTSSNGERVVKGSYSKNKKTGLWHYHWASRYATGSTVDMYKSYQDGKLQGPCSYTDISNATKKALIKSTAYFNDNIQAGRFLFESFDNIVFGTKTVAAIFDDDGRFNGEVISTTYKKRVAQGVITINTVVDKCQFGRGILFSRILRDVTSGTVFVNVKRDSLIRFYNFNYNAATNKCVVPYIVFKPWRYLTNSVDSWQAGHEGIKYIGTTPPNSSVGDVEENTNCCLRVVSPIFSDTGSTNVGYDAVLAFWYKPTFFDKSGQYYNDGTPIPPAYNRGEEKKEFRPEVILGFDCRD